MTYSTHKPLRIARLIALSLVMAPIGTVLPAQEIGALSKLESLRSLSTLEHLQSMGNLQNFVQLRALSQLRALESLQVLSGIGQDLDVEYGAQDDPADSMFRSAQAALRRGEHQRAAELFRSVRTRFPRSRPATDAGYWEAFSLHRLSGRENLRTALELLTTQRARYPDASSAADARSLAARIEGQLASMGDSRSAQSLINRADRMAGTCPKEDEDERLMVLDALLTMDSERALPTLKTVLARRDECSAVLRRKAVFLVSRKGSSETEDILVDVLRNDPDKEVREQAVFWLGQANTGKSTNALLEVLRTSRDAAVLEKAVFSLAQQRNERAQMALRDMARRSDLDIEVRANAIFWLGQRAPAGSNAEQFLVDLYPSLNETKLKERALFAIAQRRSPESQRFLAALAANAREPMEVRRTALFHAGQAGMPLSQMRDIMRATNERELRSHLVFVIANRKTPEAVDALMDIVRTETDVEIRKTAIFWLGQSKDPRAGPFLLSILDR